MKFSHLHVHTQYSLLDGAASIKGLYKKAIADEMPAIAISDHGNLFGAFEFVKEAWNNLGPDKKPLIKPVVGCEFYITADRHRKQFTKQEKDQRNHQILLAKNATGYKNLVKLCSLGFIEGMYGKYPRIDKELIHKYHDGLIATTCCLAALVPQTILKEGEAAGENEFKWWLNIFQNDYYIELQKHGIPDQDKVNAVLLKFAKKYNVKVIASNDSHYVDQTDFNAHDILLCINTGEKQSTPANRDFVEDDVAAKNMRFAFPNDQFFFKTTTQMGEVFHDLPEALDNTNEIVDKVELLDLKRDILLPHFQVPSNFKSQPEYLASITWAGAKERYKILTPEIEERISFELKVIEEMGFAGYFLIVGDFIRKGKEIGVFVGPGRGSAAGSVVAYCIGITNIDPIKYNLLFERFLNPERKSMPDIDTDFDDEGRQKVIDYVVDKYGKSQVAQIITYGTMAAKSSIADVARVMDLPLPESRALSKLVPERPGINLKRLLHAPEINSEEGNLSLRDKEGLSADEFMQVRKLREIYNTDSLHSKILHEAELLEGSVRNTGIHAAGIIIAPEDLTNLIPVATSKESPLWVTQIEGNSIEDAGVIKMDFLGLKTLSILKNALKLIKENHGVEIDLDSLPLDDEKTFELYQQGATNGTFQFESSGMQNSLRELMPDKFEDLIAMNALYRPGPMDYIPKYIARKHGKEEVAYDIEDTAEFLQETYGITVYQEQVMLLSQKLAGFTKGQADSLRKAMGKKKKKEIDALKADFIKGGVENNYKLSALEKIWTDWEAFAQYAFNKSHSTCYAFVAYQTAYLKAHYPSEFMSAVLNYSGSIEKITFYMEECKRMGLKVLGPDINESKDGFSVNENGEIRFGFTGLKGVGEAAIENIIDERKKGGRFLNIFDFVKRVNLRAVNKKSMESLIYGGAFDNFNELHRAQYFHQPNGDVANLEKIMKFGQVCQSQTATSANTLFGDIELPPIEPPKLPNCHEWELITKLDYEKEVTGMFMSGHPLDNYRFEFTNYGIMPVPEFDEILQTVRGDKSFTPPNCNYRIAGIVKEASHRQTKTGNNYGVVKLEDKNGVMELFVFGQSYLKYNHFLSTGSYLNIEGKFGKRFSTSPWEFQIHHISLLSQLKVDATKSVSLFIPIKDVNEQLIDFLSDNRAANPGKSSLKINILKDAEGKEAISLQTQQADFSINDSFIDFIYNNEHIGVYVNC